MTQEQKDLIARAREALDHPKRNLEEYRAELGDLWARFHSLPNGRADVRSLRKRINKAIAECDELMLRLANRSLSP